MPGSSKRARRSRGSNWPRFSKRSLRFAEAAGARLLVITNEHPEILERTEPTADLGPKVQRGIAMLQAASEMRVTSVAGTDLTIDLRDAPCGGTPGFGTTPGAVAHWPGGLCLAFPGPGTVNGRVVMDVGDMNLTFKTYLSSQIDFTVENDFVTGTTVDVDGGWVLREG